MKYNTLGKTGLNVSALGLGGHEYRWSFGGNRKDSRFTSFNPERIGVIKEALDNGVNFFDTTFLEEVQSLGHHLNLLGCRKDVIVNGMLINPAGRSKDKNPSALQKSISKEMDTSLQLLKSDYFDIFMLCYIDYEYDQNVVQDMVAIYSKLKEEGKCRYIGVSCHNHDILYDFLNLDLPVDVVMFVYNFAISHNWGKQYNRCPEIFTRIEEKNLGAIAIKGLTWFTYGIPFTMFDPDGSDIEEEIVKSVAWQTTVGKTDATFMGVETVKELKSNLAGVQSEYDHDSLKKYLDNGRRFDLLIRNAPKYSREIQEWILNRVKGFTKQDFGDDLKQYYAFWEREMNSSLMSYSRI